MTLLKCLMVLAAFVSSQDIETDKPVTPGEAARLVGKKCTVEMTVKASKNAMAHRKVMYLDSETDFRDAKNFAAVLSSEAVEEYGKAGIDDPAAHFKGKTLRVSGTVSDDEKKKPRIVVDDPKQISVVEKNESARIAPDLLSLSFQNAAALPEGPTRLWLIAEIATAQFRAGDEAAFRATIEALPNSGRDVAFRDAVWGDVAVIQARRGDIDGALRTADGQRAPSFRDLSRRRIAIVCEKAGDSDRACRAVLAIESAKFRVDTLSKLVPLRLSRGDCIGAKAAVDFAAKASTTIADRDDKVTALRQLAIVQAAVGDTCSAAETFRQLRELAATDEFSGLALQNVATAQAEALDIKGARETLKEIGEDKWDVFGGLHTDNVLRAIVEALARTGRLREATEALAEISAKETRARALAAVAEARLKSTDIEGAERAVNAALALVEHGNSPHELLALAAIANVQIRMGDFGGATSTADRCVTGIGDELRKNILSAQLDMQDVDSAMAMYARIRVLDEFSLAQHRLEAARILARHHMRVRPREIMSWAQNLSSPAEKAAAYLGMADSVLAKKGALTAGDPD